LFGYAICSVERSGSTLLSDLLEHTGVAGRPVVEPFNMPVQATAFQRHRFSDYGSYLAFARQRACTSNGVFGINLMWRHLARVDMELRRCRTWAGETSLQMLQHYLPELRHFVFTQRRDALAQAVSWAIAYQTDRWRSSDPDLGRTPSYDFSLVDLLYETVLADNRGWETWFALHGIEPLRIEYEDLAAHHEAVARRTLEFFGLPIPPDVRFESRYEKQATSVNQLWCERYTADLADMSAAPLPSDWLHD
jgi:LPS sulfotransferase NodH